MTIILRPQTILILHMDHEQNASTGVPGAGSIRLLLRFWPSAQLLLLLLMPQRRQGGVARGAVFVALGL